MRANHKTRHSLASLAATLGIAALCSGCAADRFASYDPGDAVDTALITGRLEAGEACLTLRTSNSGDYILVFPEDSLEVQESSVVFLGKDIRVGSEATFAGGEGDLQNAPRIPDGCPENAAAWFVAAELAT